MKMTIIKTSDCDYENTKEFSSLQELLDFIKKQGKCILTPIDVYNCTEWFLEIYDAYKE